MSTLHSELEKLAQQTKQNYESVLACQYQSLCDKHGVRLTLEESREALTRLGYISVEGKVLRGDRIYYPRTSITILTA